MNTDYSLRTYYQNGTTGYEEHLLTDDVFAVQVFESNGMKKYFYRNDSLIVALDNELVDVYDRFVDLYFTDVEEYYRISEIVPDALLVGGQSSDVTIDKESFIEIKKIYDDYFSDLNKYIYVNDCQYLISTVQHLLQSAEYCFVQYFIQISKIEIPKNIMSNAVFQQASQESMFVSFFVETFFTKMYSILDLMVKIVYELEYHRESFDGLKKLKSAERIWGDKKNISLNNLPNSIFEDCNTVRIIETLRNEAVHNGAWEFRPKVYVNIENQVVLERFMLFPDTFEGRFISVKNRKHFFSKKLKVNDVIVDIHDDFYRRLLFTIKYINEKYSVDKCD